MPLRGPTRSSPLTSDPPSEMYVLGHDGDPLRMNRTEVCILKQPNEVSLSSLLEGSDGRALEPEVSLGVLRYLPNEPLKGQLPDQ